MKYISISDDVILGKDVKIINFVNLYGCTIDDGTKLGNFVEIQKPRKKKNSLNGATKRRKEKIYNRFHAKS